MNEAQSEHTAEGLLPFYLNGTLDDLERQQVEQALAASDDLRNELSFLSALQLRVKQFSPLTHSPGELGLKRLQQHIRKRGHAKRSLRGWRLAAIAASVVVVAQAVILLSATELPMYRSAGGETATAPAALIVRVSFAPHATEQEIRTVLVRCNARIVDGPSALGVYQLSLPDTRKQSLDSLRAEAIIETLQVE